MLSWLSGLYKLSKNMYLYLKVSLELHLGQQENVVIYVLKINIYSIAYMLINKYIKIYLCINMFKYVNVFHYMFNFLCKSIYFCLICCSL